MLGLAAIITYYKGGKRGDTEIVPNDDKAILDLLTELWATNNIQKVTEGVLAAEFIWGENLNNIAGLTDTIVLYLNMIQENGMKKSVELLIEQKA